MSHQHQQSGLALTCVHASKERMSYAAASNMHPETLIACVGLCAQAESILCANADCRKNSIIARGANAQRVPGTIHAVCGHCKKQRKKGKLDFCTMTLTSS